MIFLRINLPQTLHVQAYLVERYCITVPRCPAIIWGNGVPLKVFEGTTFPHTTGDPL